MSLLQAVWEEFGDRLSGYGNCCIAGGAVRDHLMGVAPKDFDVFVLGLEPDTNITPAFEGLEAIEPLPHHKSEPFLKGTFAWSGTMVQVMVTPCETVDDLLATFDWNVCLFAFNGQLHQRAGIEEISEGKPLVLQKVTYPMSTLRRGFRFSERFGMIFRPADIKELCGIVSGKDKENQ